MSENNETWAIVSLMGHQQVSGRITKPGEFGGLWQIDIPEGDSYRTKFFGNQAVFSIDIVSEEIARGYATVSNEIIEYNAPIITREEHQIAMDQAQQQIINLQRKIDTFQNRLISNEALPAGE